MMRIFWWRLLPPSNGLIVTRHNPIGRQIGGKVRKTMSGPPQQSQLSALRERAVTNDSSVARWQHL